MSLATLVWRDVKTGIEIQDRGAKTIEELEEFLWMYRYFLPEDLVEIRVKELSNEEVEKCHPIFVEKKYSKNPFGLEFQGRMFTFSVFYSKCDEMYKSNKEQSKIIGSMPHIGFVNKIFDYHHNSKMEIIRVWIEIIHQEKNLKTAIEKLTLMNIDHRRELIYKGRFFTDDVKNICKYCEIMFGISRFEVATFFEKHNPDEILSLLNEDKPSSKNKYIIMRVGAIYAELGNYEKAKEFYQRGLEMRKDNNNWPSYVDEFEEHYKKYGTSILSSTHF